jgi:type I restriction enzyme R subunit
LNPDAVEGRLPDSMGKRLFSNRVELIGELDGLGTDAGEPEHKLRTEVAEFLRIEVAGMNLDNFIVRPRRRSVERYAEASAWERLSTEAVIELTNEVAGLPSSVTDDDQDAKQFDLLMLRMQLTLLRHEPGFDRMQAQVMNIASLLEEKSSIPIVAAQLALLHEIQTDEFWTDIQLVQLETVRRRLRSLVKLIERTKRKIVYTAFEDELGEEAILSTRTSCLRVPDRVPLSR